ncbi:MAG: cupin domain-containing protein [Dehalococcoidia bacterium]|nr:cupin domain-containing protein [Dehalococcoidia bacterium]MDW8120644.1 cupin domain-containing protein [Chloroflexota bacterium]
MTQEVTVIHPDQYEVEVSSGAMTRHAGVSQKLCGTTGIHLAIARIPPGCRSSPHYHVNCESAIYVLKGRGRFLVGERLEKALPIGPGDFIYVPPGAVHAPVNDSMETMELIVARNTPVEIVVEWDAERGAPLASPARGG